MRERELLEGLTPAQRAEWVEARRTGGTTDLKIGMPDSCSDGRFHPWFDDDAREWHVRWVGEYFDVAYGKPEVYTWECDEDGNFEEEYLCTLWEYTHAKEEEYLKDAIEAEREYMEDTRGERAGRRAEQEYVRQASKLAQGIVEPYIEDLPQERLEALADAMERADLPIIYEEMTANDVGEVVKFIIEWKG